MRQREPRSIKIAFVQISIDSDHIKAVAQCSLETKTSIERRDRAYFYIETEFDDIFDLNWNRAFFLIIVEYGLCDVTDLVVR